MPHPDPIRGFERDVTALTPFAKKAVIMGILLGRRASVSHETIAFGGAVNGISPVQSSPVQFNSVQLVQEHALLFASAIGNNFHNILLCSQVVVPNIQVVYIYIYIFS
jgi:hypothetical protein